MHRVRLYESNATRYAFARAVDIGTRLGGCSWTRALKRSAASDEEPARPSIHTNE